MEGLPPDFLLKLMVPGKFMRDDKFRVVNDPELCLVGWRD